MYDSLSYRAADNRYEKSQTLYRRCGHSGVLLPRVSLGLWKGFGAGRPYEESRRILHYAFDHGITHFDLANNYGPPYGSAETTFGRAMADSFRPYRDELFVATKAGYDMWPGPYGNWGSRKYLTASLDQSLRRMGLDYVDLFYTHRYDPQTPVDETLQALADLVHAGKALYVGISRWPLEQTFYAVQYLAAQHVRVLTYQGRLNLLDREPEEAMLGAVRELQTGFVSFSPLAQGLLTDRYLDGIPADSRMRTATTLREEQLTPDVLAKLRKWNGLARRRGDTLARLALRWVLAHEDVTSVIVGVSRLEQLADDLLCLEGEPLTSEEMAALD